MSRPRSKRRLQCVAFAALAIHGGVSAPALGQEAVDKSVSAATATCMSRSIEPSGRAGEKLRPVNVLAIEGAIEMLAKKGFIVTNCEEVGLATAADRNAWRDDICTLASQGNVAVQNQLEGALGERPAVLCAMAEALAGPWLRTDPIG